MSEARAAGYRAVAEAAYRWVLDQVRWDDGPWIPETASLDGSTAGGRPVEYAEGMHSGIGGLAHLLAEIRLDRTWTPEEARLVAGVAERLRSVVPEAGEANYFDGLVSHLGALGALGQHGSDTVVARLATLADAEGWPQSELGPPRYRSGARISDVTLGTAGVLLGAVWAHRRGIAGADALAAHAADVLLAEAETEPTGLNWLFVPRRFCVEPVYQMPNWSHGLAGVAAALALAGAELGRPDLLAAARSGAEHLVTLDVSDGQGFEVPHVIPRHPDYDEVTYSWCHGPTGTSLLFLALDRAGVPDVARQPPLTWHRRCLDSIRASGLPARLRPGFWDNDGRCCGTAGVLEVFLDSWQRAGDPADLAFAVRLADALVERAILDRDRAYWRFVEHRAAEPLLPPGVGWMQGAAGIAAVLLRTARVLEHGRQAPTVDRLDSWWSRPPPISDGQP